MLSKEQIAALRNDVGGKTILPSVFNALSDEGRFRIFRLLMRNEDLCVTDIAHVLNTSVPAASQQLKVLEQSGLVSRERQGQMICYRLRQKDSLVQTLTRIIGTS